MLKSLKYIHYHYLKHKTISWLQQHLLELTFKWDKLMAKFSRPQQTTT